MTPPNRLNVCWDSLDARVRTTSARLSPARKTHPRTLAVGVIFVPAICYLVAHAGLGFPPAPFSRDLVVVTLILTLFGGGPIFAGLFLRGVFLTTVTVYPGEGIARKSWGPFHIRLVRKWVPVGDGPWRIVPAKIKAESAALHDAVSGLGSLSPAAMMSGFQTLLKADEELAESVFTVWGLTGDDPEAPDTQVIAWFLSDDDAQVALIAIVQAGGTAMPTEQPHVFSNGLNESEADASAREELDR